jgi:Uma2 family endonuclease
MTIVQTPIRRNRPARQGGPTLPELRAMDDWQLARLGEKLGGLPVPGVRMTERQFFDWAFENVDAEWVDGEVILMAPASDAHEGIDEWLGRLLGEYIERRDLGILRRNMFLRLPRRRRLRVPDLMYVSTAHRGRVKPTLVDDAPDMIIEIVSPDSHNRDRREKYLEYEAGGVPEYWIIDPLTRTVSAYTLRGRKFEPIRPADDDRYDSAVLPGVFLRAKWLFAAQRPKVAQVLKEFGIKS